MNPNPNPTKSQLASEITALVDAYRGRPLPWLGEYKRLRVDYLLRLRDRMAKAVELKESDPGRALAYFMGWEILTREEHP